MLKMQQFYTNKKITKIESKGSRFEVGGDFVVKLGTVTISDNFRGILVECEYLPCVIPATCWDLIREFMQSFLGSCVSNTPSQYIQAKLNDIYHPRDTAFQYLEHFTMLRKQMAPPPHITR